MRRRSLLSGSLALCGLGIAGHTTAQALDITAPGEFEPQDYIWLSWYEEGFLGSAPFSTVATEVMKAITPAVKVRLIFSDERTPYGTGQRQPVDAARRRILSDLRTTGIDTSRVELIHYPRTYGAIQDPGPVLLRTPDGLIIADYGFAHPDPRTEAMDRDIAALLGLKTIKSPLVSEGGARQTNGKGVLMLVEAVERDRNPGWSLADIEREHKRMHGATKIIWLQHGPAEEEWGLLSDGRWGIGTGGHVDVFARFADASTILLAEVSTRQRDTWPLMKETWARMEANAAILSKATDQDGRPFRIVRVPVPDPMIATADYDALSPEERSWFEGAKPGQTLEYYLPGGYLNLIIANEVVVTARLWEPGRPETLRDSDARAAEVLAGAFPGRRIVQVGVTPLLHDGAGLHCHSRNQPFA